MKRRHDAWQASVRDSYHRIARFQYSRSSQESRKRGQCVPGPWTAESTHLASFPSDPETATTAPLPPRVRGELAIRWRNLVATERLLPRSLAQQDRRRRRRAVANAGRGPISLTRLWRESMSSDRPRHDAARVQKQTGPASSGTLVCLGFGEVSSLESVVWRIGCGGWCHSKFKQVCAGRA